MDKKCANCGSSFDVTEDDLQFLKKLSPEINGVTYALPPPTLCPSCRFQRRFAMRNENKLYRRTCALTGKPMISLYSPDKPYTVYSEAAWSGDAWDPMSYGTDFDFLKPFFDQFDALMHRVPRRGMHQDGLAENSDYTAFGMNNKNCYLAFSCFICEDVYCSAWTVMAKNCIDCFFCVGTELLYECVDCNKCYHCFYCHDCNNCRDSLLLEDCRNCTNCICCKNLRNKEYHIYNKPVTKEEFEAKRKELLDGGLVNERKTFDVWRVTLPTPYARITQAENCSGDYIDQAKNCTDCFAIQLGAEDCRHCQACGWKCKDMMDCSSAGKNAEVLYEMHATANGTHRCMGDSFVGNCEHVYYSENMDFNSHCFGCIGLRHKKFCILNRQYTEQEYFALLPKLIEHMKTPLRSADGKLPPSPSGYGGQVAGQEWGEFFPVTVSPFCYNETLAHEHFPLSKEEVLAKGWKWKDVTGDPPQVSKVIHAKDLPATITDVTDGILDMAIECEATKKPFRIIKQELDFYRKEGLPLPHLHPEERHRRRMAQRTPYKLWARQCAKCGKEVQTSFQPSRPEIIFCDECYLKTVY